MGNGHILDLGGLNAIISIDPEQRIARVQPGVVLSDLNDRLQPYDLVFPPDPSTATRCQIGGMMGNNAWGAHAPLYGTTRDWILKADVVLSDGSTASFGPGPDNQLQLKLASDTLEGRIYRCLNGLLGDNHDLILAGYPSAKGIQSNAGYALDVLARQLPWQANGRTLNLAPFLCGSEGTLAITTEMTLKLAPLPKTKGLLCVHFHTMDEALAAVAYIAARRPAAIELLDDTILSLTAQNPLQSRNRFWIEGAPKAVLLVEFFGHQDAQLNEQCKVLTNDLKAAGIGYAYPLLQGQKLEEVWELRRAGLGLLMGLPMERQAVTGIEDTAVALSDLANYAQDVRALVHQAGTDCVMYGSVGMGLIHFRPFFDLSEVRHRQSYAELMLAVAACVQRYRGTCSTKHGDGRLRAHLLPFTLGDEIVGLLRKVKSAFDPQGILNPGKVLDAPDVLSDLRGTLARTTTFGETGFAWQQNEDFVLSASQCHGAGTCLQSANRGAMCPSFQATHDEVHSPRGRSSLLFAALLNQTEIALSGPELESALSLCLSCKACKSECPANVDIAKLKAEIQHQRHKQLGIPWRSRMLNRFELLCQLGSRVPLLANRLMKSAAFKQLANIAAERPLPCLAAQSFSRWFQNRKHPVTVPNKQPVALLVDPFVEYFEPHIGQCATELLEAMGFTVRISPALSSGRLAISLGLLDLAKNKAEHLLDQLEGLAEPGVPLVGLEPSEILTLRDEYLDLLPPGKQRDRARRLVERSHTFEEFLARTGLPDRPELRLGDAPLTLAVVHLHCHEKALLGNSPASSAFNLIPTLRYEILKTGCCGMAGLFGYQTRNYKLSQRIGELTLAPALRSAATDTIVVANGTSCRQQILHLTGIQARHSAELFHKMLLGDGLLRQ